MENFTPLVVLVCFWLTYRLCNWSKSHLPTEHPFDSFRGLREAVEAILIECVTPLVICVVAVIYAGKHWPTMLPFRAFAIITLLLGSIFLFVMDSEKLAQCKRDLQRWME